LTSPRARAESAPLDELERLLDAVEEELQTLRARVAPVPKGALDREARHRIELLDRENQLLRQRIGTAKDLVERLRTRLRFIEDRGESA
jgi:predicted RNase H-like nuclease (RuvC/YqgF family)